MAMGRFESTSAAVTAGQAVKRLGEPADIAETIAYLASPQAGFITGQTIYVNGGLTYG